MRKRIIIIATLIAALAAVPFVYGAGGPGGKRGMRGMHGMHGMHGGGAGFGILGQLGRLKAELELTDAQVEQLRAIFKETREQNEAYRDELKGGMHEVAQILLDNPDNIAGAEALIARHNAARDAMKQNMLNATSRGLKVLSAEQRAKLSGILAERAQRFQQRRGR